MKNGILSIIAMLLAVVGLLLATSWYCLIPFGLSLTLGIIGVFTGGSKFTSIAAVLVSTIGIFIMCQFAGFAFTIGFSPIGINGINSALTSGGNDKIDSREDAVAYAQDTIGDSLSDEEAAIFDDALSSDNEDGLGVPADDGGTDSDISSADAAADDNDADTAEENSGSTDLQPDPAGSWMYDLNGHTITFTFNADGSGAMEAEGYTTNLEWERHQNTLTISYYDDAGALAETEEMTFTVDGDTLSLNRNGSITTLTKK